MYRIEFHHDADEEMKAAAAYYEERVKGLGSDFLDEIEQGLSRILQFPLGWSFYEGEYRRYFLKRFPYSMIYRIENEKIFIIAVAHLHRKPGYWKNRVRHKGAKCLKLEVPKVVDNKGRNSVCLYS